jgi:hypothetical protein
MRMYADCSEYFRNLPVTVHFNNHLRQIKTTDVLNRVAYTTLTDHFV